MEVPLRHKRHDRRRSVVARRVNEAQSTSCQGEGVRQRDKSRRSQDQRRSDTLGRTLVHGLRTVGFTWLASQVVLASKRRLVGPIVMSASAVIAFLFFAQQLGWMRSAAIIAGLMIHETGHFFFTMMRGQHPHWWWFSPIGVFMHPPKISSRSDEAWIALGGPLAGVVFSVTMFLAGLILPLPNEWITGCFVFAKYGLLLNLFNLTPISPLDGGRITQASHWFFQVVGFTLLLLWSWWVRDPMILIVWMIIAIEKFMGFPVWRFVAALGILTAMGFLIGATFGGTHLIENVAYVLFGIVLVAMCRPSQYVGDDNAEEFPQLSRFERFLWGIGWSSLTMVTVVLYVVAVANQPGML